MTVQEQIRSISRELLSEGKVDLVIGYGAGTLPGTTAPVFITNPDDADRLVWNQWCTNNLALYAQRRFAEAKKSKDPRIAGQRIAVVTKKCDARALVELIRDKQIDRERLVVIGVPCSGMLDKKKVQSLGGAKEIRSIEVKGADVIISGKDFEITGRRDDLLRDCCITCQDAASLPISDYMLSPDDDYVKPVVEDDFSDVREYEEMSPQERWQAFKDEFKHCIRCYACRNACPMCYCTECFADCSQPRWIGGSVELKDVLFFQIMRILHQAGRCVDCGACAAACPMGLDIRKYTRSINRDAIELFGFEAGEIADEKPLLSTFKPDDKQDFITEPEKG